MDANDYNTAWLIYLGAALVLSVFAWRFLRRFLLRELAYLLQCWLLALLFTPWYVLEDQDILAPALIVFALDTITIAPVAGIRALTPLVLALMAGLLLAVLLSVVYRVRRHGEPQSQAMPAASVETPHPAAVQAAMEPVPAAAAGTSTKSRVPRKKKVVEPALSTPALEEEPPESPAPKKPRRKPAPKLSQDSDVPQS